MFREYLPVISAGVAMLIVLTLVPVASHKTQVISAAGNRCIDPESFDTWQEAGLLHWWDGDNNSANIVRDTIGGADGNMLNSAGGNSIQIVDGKVGKAFSFAGNDFDANGNKIPNSGPYIRLPDAFTNYPTGGAVTTDNKFTYELWFKTNSEGVIFGQQLAAKIYEGLGGWIPPIYVGTDGLIGSEPVWQSPWADPARSNKSIKDNQWHHYAVTFDGAQVATFLDGGASAKRTRHMGPFGNYTFTIGTGSDTNRVGGIGGWHTYKGEVDEFSIYNRNLTAPEIKAIFDAGEFGKCKLECNNNVIQDSIGEVCDGTELAGETCETQKGPGFTGPLGCKSDCSGYDLSKCDAPPACSDGKDNDGDKLTDYPHDPGCSNAADKDETDPPPPPIKRSVSFSKSAAPQIVIQPLLGEREVLVFDPPCPTCTVNTTPDHTQFVGGTPSADQGFVIIAQSFDSSDSSLSYTIVAVGDYQVETQLFTADGKEYTNVQR